MDDDPKRPAPVPAAVAFEDLLRTLTVERFSPRPRPETADSPPSGDPTRNMSTTTRAGLPGVTRPGHHDKKHRTPRRSR